MIYKCRVIEDREYVDKSQLLANMYSNSQDFTLDDIEGWKEHIIKKTEELKSKGVDFKDVTIGIIGDGFQYNPDGADTEPYMDIYIQWQELETDYEREKRIEREKKLIDEDIEREKRMEEAKKLAEKVEIERSIETLRRAGYQVI